MKLLNLPALGAAVLVSFAVVVPFLPSLRENPDSFALEVTLTSTTAGRVQVFWDRGSGYSEQDSSSLPVPKGGPPAVYRLKITAGTYRSLRFDPIDGDGTVVLYSASIVDRDGGIIRRVPLTDFSRLNQIQSLERWREALEVRIVPGGSDPQLLVRFDPPLVPTQRLLSVAGEMLPRAAGVLAVLVLVLWSMERMVEARRALMASIADLARRPRGLVALVSALAVGVSAYPVAFGGKSYVAPNLDGVRLLYDTDSTLPGYNPSFTTNAKGSDVGAIFWQHIPLSMIEHRALVRDWQWPLWNRYDSCGVPLLGQGQSMFGDPLHLLVVAANGAAWAWDFKYLTAKWLLAAGLGLLVLTVVGRTSAAVIVALAAPFFGFFIFRYNHPAFFSFCYAPWSLYCWIRASGAPSARSTGAWAVALVGANIALMNSGTVKEAYMLLVSMNFSGLCVAVAAEQSIGLRLRKLAMIAWGQLLFLMITAPVWVTFLDTLRWSYTSYDTVSAFQIQPSLLIGAFDEALFRPLTRGEIVFNPSANFLILAGVLYFLATLRSQFANRTAISLAFSSVVPLALAFGLVPAFWIVRIPFLGNVAHIDNCFTCALIILWSVMAGAGFATAATRLGRCEGRGDLAIAGLLLFALVFSYVGYGQAVHRPIFPAEPVFSALKAGESLPKSLFVQTYLFVLVAALIGLGWVAHRSLKAASLSCSSALVLGLCVWTLLWRQGLQPPSAGFGGYALQPGPRPDFHAVSAAMEHIGQLHAAEPMRGVGLEGTFFPGWTAVYGIEGISGPDALMNPYYRELTGLSPITRLWDWRLYVPRETISQTKPFLDFMNVGYYFGMPGELPTIPGLSLESRNDLDVYESSKVWPRAFFTNRLAVYDEPAEFVRLVMSGDGRPFAAVQRADSDDKALRAVPHGVLGRVVIPAGGYQLTERMTAFTVHASEPGVVVLAEAFLPDYARAQVNGAEARIIRINHAFQGIVITEAGDYRITVSYEPRRFWRSVLVSVSGLGLLASSLFGICRLR